MGIKFSEAKLSDEDLEKVNGGYIHSINFQEYGYSSKGIWEIINDNTGEVLETVVGYEPAKQRAVDLGFTPDDLTDWEIDDYYKFIKIKQLLSTGIIGKGK